MLSNVFCFQYYLEPPEKLAEALRKHKLAEKDFFTLNHGETRLTGDKYNLLD